jgi:hypothetical protein
MWRFIKVLNRFKAVHRFQDGTYMAPITHESLGFHGRTGVIEIPPLFDGSGGDDAILSINHLYYVGRGSEPEAVSEADKEILVEHLRIYCDARGYRLVIEMS